MGRQRTSVLRRVTGMGSAGGLALALLAGGCVLAATAGPREAQAMQARALQQTVDGVPPSDRTIVVSSSWTQLSNAMQGADPTLEYYQNLTPAAVNGVTDKLHDDFSDGSLQLTPLSTDWVGMTPPLFSVIP